MAMEVQVEKKDRGPKGLKLMRAGWIGQPRPEHKCDNCGCMRYNECYCPRAKEKKEKADGNSNEGPVGNNEGQ